MFDNVLSPVKKDLIAAPVYLMPHDKVKGNRPQCKDSEK
jgi:hypothetical protein